MTTTQTPNTDQDQATAGESSEARTQRFNLRSTASDGALIRQAAMLRRMTVTEFMLNASVEEAKRALNEDRRLEVLGEVYDRLSAELDEPGQVVDAMVDMIKQPRRLQFPN